MRLAVLKERRAAETRVAATPETVKRLIGLGLTVAVEAGMILAALLYIRKVTVTTTVSRVTPEYVRQAFPHSLQTNELPEGVAVYRIHENTFDGVQMYVDDLVTDAACRSRGVGKALLDHLQRIARDARCNAFTLDSGTQRQQAHKFYFREGMTVTCFHFAKPLGSEGRA